MDRGFDKEKLLEPGAQAAKEDQEQLQHEVGTGSSFTWRHRQWLLKKPGKSNWRPKTLYRAGARRIAEIADNHLRVSTPFGGLGFFRYDSERARWKKASLWPGIGMPLDQCATNVSFMHAMMYRYDLNIWPWWDTDHMVKNNWEVGLKDAHLYEFQLLLLISDNYKFGPIRNDERKWLHQATMAAVYAEKRPEDVALFMALCPNMVQELEGAGVVEFAREQRLEDEVWRFLELRNANSHIGRRVSMCRYGAPVAARLTNQPFWSVDAFETAVVAIEHDMAKGRRLVNKLKLKAGAAEGVGEGAGTKPELVQIEDRALKGCCQNHVMVRLLTLEEPHHQRLSAIIGQLSRPFKDYLTHYQRSCKSVQGAAAWRLEMFGPALGFMKHLESFIDMLNSTDMLEQSGFVLVDSADELPFEDNSDILIEDQFAEKAGDMSWGFLRNTLRRHLHLLMPPYSFTACRASMESAHDCIDRFKKDLALFRKLERSENPTIKEKKVISRSRFQTRMVKHLEALILESVQTYSGGLASRTEERDNAMIGTNLIENMNGVQKCHRAKVKGMQWRNADGLMAATLEHELVTKRYDYKQVPFDQPLQHMTATLPNDAFHASKATMSLDLSDMVSTSATPTWWSPSVGNYSVPDADIFVSRDVDKRKIPRVWDKLWVGRLCSIKHHICLGFRKPMPGKALYEWYVAVDYFKDSGVFVWPVTRDELVPGKTYVEPHKNLKEPTILAMHTLDLNQIKAFRFAFRSWAWQVAYIPRAAERMRPAIRIFMDQEKPESVERVATAAAWWDLSRTELVPFFDLLKVKFAANDDLFDLLWKQNKKVHKASDALTLRTLQKRLVELEKKTVTPSLLEIDECIDVLEQNDIQKVEQAKKSTAEMQEHAQRFRSAYYEKARAVAKAAAGGGGPDLVGGGGAGGGGDGTPLPPHITQVEAKQYAPEGGYVWVGYKREAWCGHYPPFKRHACSWTTHGGSDAALRELLRLLWDEHLFSNGLPRSACPWNNLFED